MATTDRKVRVPFIIMVALVGLIAASITGQLVALIPAGGVILAVLLLTAGAAGLVGSYVQAAPRWLRAYAGLLKKRRAITGIVAALLAIASLQATFMWWGRVATERASVEAAQRAADAKAQAEAELRRAKDNREQQLDEEFSEHKDQLFSDLEAVGDLISGKEMVAATVALVKLSGSVTVYSSSRVAERSEYDSLVRNLNSNKRRLEGLIAEKKPEFERRFDEVDRLARKKSLDEAEKNLTQIEQELAPLEGLDEMRLPPSLRDLRESARTRIDDLRLRIAERRNEHDIGDKITLGGFAYVVQDVDQKDAVGNWITRETAGEGATFLIVRYTIENLGSETETVLADDFEVQDSGGRNYSPSAEANTALAMSGGSKDLFASELHPGVKRKMTTAFEVPKAMLKDGFTIVIPEKGLFGTGRAKIGPLVFR